MLEIDRGDGTYGAVELEPTGVETPGPEKTAATAARVRWSLNSPEKRCLGGAHDSGAGRWSRRRQIG
jgi:hypothetical protein